jgi:hypothetical protein
LVIYKGHFLPGIFCLHIHVLFPSVLHAFYSFSFLLILIYRLFAESMYFLFLLPLR